MMVCSGLTKRYGSVLAADDISFVAADGMVTGLLGPNGAGKTTTIRTLIGLSRPDRGTATIDGIDVMRAPAAARARLGVLPEAVGLYDRLTVREHLQYSAELHGLPAATIAAGVDAVLTQLSLAPLADRPAGQLSQGQARRVALGRALVQHPANVILDEPSNGLDVMSTREVRRVVRQLADSGRAVLLSSHVMPEVSALCDSAVLVFVPWISNRLYWTGAPANATSQVFGWGLLGAMTLLGAWFLIRLARWAEGERHSLEALRAELDDDGPS